jgi:hypothetical protein
MKVPITYQISQVLKQEYAAAINDTTTGLLRDAPEDSNRASRRS